MRHAVSLRGSTAVLAVALGVVLAPACAAQTTATDDVQSTDGTTAKPVKDKKPADIATDDQSNDIVVNGYRTALANALQKKKDAPNVVEVLSSEDIGKLPDPSIAESLARLPGVAANRDRGNATTLTIRGMGEELTNTLINGREIVTAEANRNARYEAFPTELINGAYIYKSPTASQAEGAIAGQVNLLTIRPLDQKKSTFVLNARGAYAPLAKNTDGVSPTGYSASGSYIGKFANDTIGVAIGYARSDEPTATERADIYPYENSYLSTTGYGSGSLEVPSGFLALRRAGRQKRDAALGTVQFKPGNGLEVVADLMWSRLDYAETQKGLEADNLVFGNYFAQSPTVVNNGATAGTLVNYYNYGATLGATNQYFAFKDNLWAGGIDTKYETSSLLIHANVGYSQVHRDQTYLAILTAPYYYDGAGNPQPVVGVTPATNAVPPLTIGYASNENGPPTFTVDRSLTDPRTNLAYAATIPSNGGGAPLINDALFTGALDLEHKFDGGIFSSIVFGGRVTDRQKDFTQRTETIPLPGQVPSQFILSPITFDGPFSGYPQTLNIDILPYINSVGGIHPTESETDKGGSWEVDETTYAAYAQINADTYIGGMHLTGNAGIRYVRTLTNSRGFTTLDPGTGVVTAATPVSYNNNYSDWLPNLNLTLKLNNRMQIRAALSKAIARAPLDSLRAGYNAYNYGTLAVYGGNPFLKPYRADQADLTYEFYINKDTAFTLAGFYKKLDSFIVTQVTAVQTTPDAMVQPGTFERPVNGSGGYIRGFEVSYQQVLSFLPKPLKGLGFYLNYSYTDSNVSVDQAENAITNIPLPNLSKHVGNAGIFYNLGGFEARVAYRARSSYATVVGGQNLLTFDKGEQLIDAYIGYTFSEHGALHGLRLSLEGRNLTDAPFETYSGYVERPGRYEDFGRTFYLSGTLKF